MKDVAQKISFIDAFSYSLAQQETELATKNCAMLSETSDSRKSEELGEKGVTPLEIVQHFASTMGRAKPPLTVASTYLIDQDKFTFSYDQNTKSKDEQQSMEQLDSISFLKSRLNIAQQQKNLFTEDLRKESFDNFKNNLSSMIKRRYKSEIDPAFSQSCVLSSKSKSNLRSNLKSSRFRETSGGRTNEAEAKINEDKMVIYGKHIDHLSAEILTALSNGIKNSGTKDIYIKL